LPAAASLLASEIFLTGAFTGKLIGLEIITVFQTAFYSLTVLENLSPCIESLVMGYNLGLTDRTFNLRRPQWNAGSTR
jgi:hypothetical protein